MLNFALKATYTDPHGSSWDYYGDDQLDPDPDPNVFYIVPRPQFALDDAGMPVFQVVRYETDDPSTGGGYFHFDVELAVPQTVSDGISAQILADPVKFPHVTTPRFVSLDLTRGGKAYFLFTGTSPVTYAADVSSFGGDTTSFAIQMTKTQLDSVVAAFGASGGGYDVKYSLSVPARLQGVTAVLSFDASIAFQYQVTQPTYDSWGDETSPASVESMLQESESSTATVTFSEPHPPASLSHDVTEWANATLANLVQAEVQKVIQLQGSNSDTSFNINEVSSFTSTFAENIVVDWIVSPTAALSFKDHGWDVKDFISTVNEQQQVMTVALNLPFAAGKASPVKMPNGSNLQALVQQVNVTVHYPGLAQANATHTFTANEPWTVATAYDGPSWGLEYQVVYADPNMPTVQGTIKDLTLTTYTLHVEEAGILTVTFDATEAFATEGVKPEKILVDLTFLNGDGTGNRIREQLTLEPAHAVGTIASFVGAPITTSYNYQLTYVFPGSVEFQPPLKTANGKTANGFNVSIPAADAVHQTALYVFEPAAEQGRNPVFEVSVQMYYEAPPNVSTLPGFTGGTFPTAAAPASYTLTPSGNTPVSAKFTGFINGDQPLMFSASIVAETPPPPIQDQPIANSISVVQLDPKVSYFTLQIDPASIDWQTVKYDQVQVLITVVDGGKPRKQQPPFIWNRSDPTTSSQYLTTTAAPTHTITYHWKINYVTQGQPVVSTHGSGSDVIFNIPAEPPAHRDRPAANSLSYYTVEIDPTSIDWKTATYDEVQVLVRPFDGMFPLTTQRAFIWSRSDATMSSKYLMTPAPPLDTIITYQWKVNYVTQGRPVVSTIGSGRDVIFNIPAAP